MSRMKDKVVEAGHKVAEKAEQAAGWVKEKAGMGAKEGSDAGVAGIKERMDVIGSCGNKLGVVDHVDGGSIRLTRKDSPDGEHHYIPTSWVHHVDSHVHLSKDCGTAKRQWTSAPTGAGA